MNILIVSYIYPDKNDPRLGLFIYEQAKELIKQGHRVSVLTSSTDNDCKEILDDIVVYRLRPAKFLKGLFFSLKAFVKIISLKDKTDIIHIHFIGINSVFCWIASRIIKVPLVATTHGSDILPKNTIHNLVIRFYLLFPKRIMAVSRFIYGLSASLTNKKKLEVVNNGVDMDKLKVKETKAALRKKFGVEGKKVLLSVGGLVERKGTHVIIKSLPDVIKKFPNLIYFVVGKGKEEKNLKMLVKSLKIEKHVKFLGFINDKELAKYFTLCDIFVLMSKTIKEKSGIEGFGIAYIEASALGKPVIGGRSGGTADAVKDGKTGFLIEPENHKELTKKILLLLNNKKIRDKMGKAGKERVMKHFLWKHNVKNTLEIYKKALSK